MSTAVKPYTPVFMSWIRETCAYSMFSDGTVLQRPSYTTPGLKTAVLQFLPKVLLVIPYFSLTLDTG